MAVAVAGLGVLMMARSLTADPRGLGTHEQLGLGVCQWYSETGRPCITCGVTTAFVLTAQGHLLAGLATQPFGAALGMALGVMVVAAAYGAWRGVSLRPAMARLWQASVGVAVAALVLLSWAYKMAVCG